MRLFTAFDPSDEVREQLASIQKKSDLAARWTPPEQFHVTVRFLGEVASDRAEELDAALKTVDVRPVEAEPYGLDVLPSRRNPRVLILGLERTDTVMALYDAVTRTLEAEGIEAEDRTYRPHVTIARLNDMNRETVHEFLRARKEASFPAFHCDQFVLYESTLTPEGAIHEPYATYRLDG